MLKAEQIQFIAYNAGIVKSEAEKAIKQFGEMIKTALSGPDGKPVLGKKIKVDGIGTWEVVKTAARKGTNPQVLAAQKAADAGTADEKQTQLLLAVKQGLVKAEYEKPEGLGIKFTAEAALKLWCGDADTEPTEAEPPTVDPNVPLDPSQPTVEAQA